MVLAEGLRHGIAHRSRRGERRTALGHSQPSSDTIIYRQRGAGGWGGIIDVSIRDRVHNGAITNRNHRRDKQRLADDLEPNRDSNRSHHQRQLPRQERDFLHGDRLAGERDQGEGRHAAPIVCAALQHQLPGGRGQWRDSRSSEDHGVQHGGLHRRLRPVQCGKLWAEGVVLHRGDGQVMLVPPFLLRAGMAWMLTLSRGL